MGMAAAKRDLVIETQHPAQLLIEVGHSSFGGEVVAVLRKGRCAADLRQIVDGFTVGKRAQQVEPMTGMLFSLDLKRVVVGVRDVADRSKPAELGKGTARLDISISRRQNLIGIRHALQVCSL